MSDKSDAENRGTVSNLRDVRDALSPGRTSRRAFLRNSAKVGTGALALSFSGSASSAPNQDGGELQEPTAADQPVAEAREFLNTLAENGQPLHTLSTEEARSFYENLFIEDAEPESVGNVENREISGPDDNEIPIRIYSPEGEGPFPVLVYFHGGGWVLGGLDTHDSVARALTSKSEAVVVSVDYRKGPEYKFPAAVEDAYAATKWVADNADGIGADPGRIAIGGESAGGNLATVTAYRMQGSGTPNLAYQLLIYPVGTLTEPFMFNADRGLSTPYLTPDDAQWFGMRYLPAPVDGQNPYASPLRIGDPSGLPPARIVTTGYGLWRDQGFAYAQKLREAGVSVEFENYPALIHDVLNMEHLPDPYPDIPQADEVLENAADALRQAFEQSGDSTTSTTSGNSTTTT